FRPPLVTSESRPACRPPPAEVTPASLMGHGAPAAQLGGTARNEGLLATAIRLLATLPRVANRKPSKFRGLRVLARTAYRPSFLRWSIEPFSRHLRQRFSPSVTISPASTNSSSARRKVRSGISG